MRVTKNRFQTIAKTAFLQDSAGVVKCVCGSQQYPTRPNNKNKTQFVFFLVLIFAFIKFVTINAVFPIT